MVGLQETNFLGGGPRYTLKEGVHGDLCGEYIMICKNHATLSYPHFLHLTTIMLLQLAVLKGHGHPYVQRVIWTHRTLLFDSLDTQSLGQDLQMMTFLEDSSCSFTPIIQTKQLLA